MDTKRRRQHTHDLLLDAAEEVFGRRGLRRRVTGRDRETAGHTRGAIYKHFADKEDLFLAANRRFNERLLETLGARSTPTRPLEQLDLASIAKQWHEMQYSDPHAFALGLEFNLFVLRHPEILKRVATQRRELAQIIADFIDQQARLTGAQLRIPSITVARIALAASDGLQLAGSSTSTGKISTNPSSDCFCPHGRTRPTASPSNDTSAPNAARRRTRRAQSRPEHARECRFLRWRAEAETTTVSLGTTQRLYAEASLGPGS